jgi:hypothetical protein
MKSHSRILGIALLAAITACGTKDAAAPLTSDPAGRIRFVNLITDATRVPVNAYLEGLPLGVNLASGATAPATLPAPATAFYAPVLAGSRSLVLKKTADTTSTVGIYALTIVAGEDQTVYGVGAGGLSVSTTDVNPAPVATEVRLRIVHMSQSTGTVDAFETAASADLTGATPNATNLAYQAASAYFTVAPASYQVRFVPAGTAPAARNASVILTLATTAFAGGTARTVVAADGTTVGTRRAILLSDR